MIRLSAFADEISPNLDEQIAVLHDEGIHHIDLRAVGSTNVLDLSDEQAAAIKQTLDEAGIAVAAIGSPIGKTAINAPLEADLMRIRRAVSLAQFFGAPTIRAFSYYPPEDGWTEEAFDATIARLRTLVEVADVAGVTVMHENEKDIYGDTAERCHRLLDAVPDLQAAFDPANFLQVGEEPYPTAYELLRPAIGYVHVKDVAADGTLVPAGQGEARWPEILQALRASGYDGILSLEPHLAAAAQFAGFSGSARFREAAGALKGLLNDIGWEYG